MMRPFEKSRLPKWMFDTHCGRILQLRRLVNGDNINDDDTITIQDLYHNVMTFRPEINVLSLGRNNLNGTAFHCYVPRMVRILNAEIVDVSMNNIGHNDLLQSIIGIQAILDMGQVKYLDLIGNPVTHTPQFIKLYNLHTVFKLIWIPEDQVDSPRWRTFVPVEYVECIEYTHKTYTALARRIKS